MSHSNTPIRPRLTKIQAPAIVEKPKVVSKTKSGRVTKTTAPPTHKAATKKRATKK